MHACVASRTWRSLFATDQDTAIQEAKLRAAGCTIVRTEKAGPRAIVERRHRAIGQRPLDTALDGLMVRAHRPPHCKKRCVGLTWTRMAKLTDEFLPKPQILHPWPSVRFAVRHPR